MGNVYVRLAPTAAGTPLFFCAHLDTVPPDGELRPVVEDGVIRNAGGTILGADNKAAVVAMLTGAGEAPQPPFDAYAALEGAASIPGRHTCALLPFDALLKALSEADELGGVGA